MIRPQLALLRPKTGPSFLKRLASAAIGSTVIAALLFVPPAAAAPYKPGSVQKESVVNGYSAKAGGDATESTGKPFRAAEPVWPGEISAEVDLPSAHSRAAGTGSPAKAGELPVWIDPTVAGAKTLSRVRVEAYGRTKTKAAGIDGLLIRVGRTDGKMEGAGGQISIDYNSFRGAYGADWANRLRLIELPECALTTPELAGCQGRVIPSTNNVKAGTVTALVDIDGATVAAPTRAVLQGDAPASTTGGTMMALAAAPEGSGGDYKATSLSPSATWNAGGNSGDFSWSYPLRVPPSLGGPAPTIGLNYTSSSVDGKMAAANSQPSWVGEGFDWHPGFIERRYGTCSEDMGTGANNSVKTGDQCWVTDNATISLPGHAGELIKDNTNANRWHLRNDDGTFVEHKTGGSNGDNDGEWWVATTPDGTQYWFGGRSGSESTLVSTVYGNHSGEPCYQTTFAASHCNQAYRWQLDYVVDKHNNTMLISYAKETNKYSKNNSTTDLVSYDRAGYPTKIEYGTRTDVSGSAPMVVEFTVADRCLANCGTKNATNFPDVPWDQECTASPCYKGSPSFWTAKRLASIKTRVWGGSAYRDVASWTLTHSFPDPVDSVTAALWLERISYSGLVGGTTSVPDITFVGQRLTNRVDNLGDQYPAMNRYRIKTINSETGGKLDVTYAPMDCVKGSRIPDVNALENNNLRCYPVKWTPSGQTSPITDFFHKYVVSDVVEADLTGSSTRVVTHYDYVGDPAWHYTDDDGMIKAENKTWSVFRGYSAVKTTKGDPGEQTSTETRFFRGMHGDKLPSGTRSVQLPAIAVGSVPAINDEDAFAGQARETITYHGPGGAEVNATITQPWQSAPTATRTINGTTVNARYSGTASSHTRTSLDGGRAAKTTTETVQYDSYGMPWLNEDRGDDAVTGDETCVLTEYARSTSPWIIDRRSRERKFAVDCTKAQAGGLVNDDIVDETRTSYDGLGWGVAPTAGDVTKVEGLKADGGFMTESRTTYDAYGRVYESWDIRGSRTVMAYTPSTGGPVTRTTETSPLGWVKTTDMEPAWGLPLTTTDANARKISFAYDGLGRTTGVWLPGRDASQSASLVYEYLVRNNAATVVTSKRLNPAGNGYITSHKFFDNLLRVRQSQDPDHAPGGTGAIVTDTFFDSAGRAYKAHDEYLASVAPSTNLFVPTGNIPSLKVTLFDGAGREVALIHKVNGPPLSEGGTEKSRTTTAYGGDRTDVFPPAGGTTTSTLVDGNGRTVEFRQYLAGGVPAHNADPATYDTTTYTYNRKDQLIQVTDSAGNKWENHYDLVGRKVKDVDPDKGTTETTYNDFGDTVTVKDSNNVTIAYTYDSIGRKTTLRDGSVTGNKRSEWVYDTLSGGQNVYGQLVKTIRYVGTDQYIKEHLGYTAGYKPTNVRYTIPSTETGLSGEYDYTYTYNPDGSSYTTQLPAAGDLLTEQLTHGYNAFGKPTTLNTNATGSTLVTGTDYTSFGELGGLHLQWNGLNKVDILRQYETDTRRLSQIWTTKQTAPTTVTDVRFTYDAAGNVTRISDVTAADHQCFKTDYLRRLTEAWTPANGDCVAAPTTGTLGGPAKYWHQFTFDKVGNRKRLVENATAAGTRTTDYTVPGSHQLTGTSTTDSGGTRTGSYTYDAAGNMKTRPTPANGTQTMTWDAEGHVAASQDNSGTTSYIYDVDGNRLVRKDPTGKTLYLPNQELRYTTSGGTKKCTRYYSHANQIVAMRTGGLGGYVWLSSDHHGTANVTINAGGSQTTAIRRETPFGEQRAATGTWPSAMDKGFVGGTKDNTGLTHLGAREYDPLIGRFVSVDPVIDDHDPQQMHGYAYGNNAPVTASDPDGLWPKWISNTTSSLAKAANTVTSAVNTVKAAGAAVVDSAKNAVTAAGKWVYNNAGAISAVTGVLALACSVIPPLQVIAPALGAISAVTGAIDTYKSCSEGASVDCAVGVAGMIPGGRAVIGAIKGTKAAVQANKGIKTAKNALEEAENAPLKHNSARQRGIHQSGVDKAKNALKDAKWPYSGWNHMPRNWMDVLDKVSFAENVLWETTRVTSSRSMAEYKSKSRQSFHRRNEGLGGKNWSGWRNAFQRVMDKNM